MKIDSGKALNDATVQERNNQENYLEDLEAWTYKYIFTSQGPLLKRIQVSYDTGEIDSKNITPQETGVVALASRYLRSDFPKNESELEETTKFQFVLQEYLGITDPKIVTTFYDDLINSVKSEHNILIPTLHVYHAQIHALKIAYDRLKGKMRNADITTRVIFGLICIEFMKMHVRLYLVEPLARTQEGQGLDWISMLDMVFEDFSIASPYNRESFRKKSVVSINFALEANLVGAMKHIKAIRDHVAMLKIQKQQGGNINHLHNNPTMDFDGARKLIEDIKRRLSDKGA